MVVVASVSLVTQTGKTEARIAGMVLWAALIGVVAPVLFIVNFMRETEGSIKQHTSLQKITVGFMNFGAFVALALSLVFGYKVVGESLWLADNPPQVSDYLEQIAQPFEARIFVNSNGDSLGYRLMKPLDYDSTRQYPVVVSLHGSSGCGKDNVRQVAAALPLELLSSHENRTKYPAFLFVPQCPGQAVWGGIPGLPAIDSIVLEAMFSLEKEFSIDGNRRYVTGASLGGYGAWHLITTRPKIFAAAMPICGAGDPALAQNIVALPIWAFHGAKDQNVPVRGSGNIVEAIKSAGGHPRYTEFPEKGHHIARHVIETPGLLDWLFAQKRK
jgi:predicted peptidase